MMANKYSDLDYITIHGGGRILDVGHIVLINKEKYTVKTIESNGDAVLELLINTSRTATAINDATSLKPKRYRSTYISRNSRVW